MVPEERRERINKEQEEAPETLRDKLDKMIELMESSSKGKKKRGFKLPIGIKIGAKGKLRKNYVLIFLLRTNGTIDIKFLQIQNDMIYLSKNQTYHISTPDFMFRYKKYPVLILPEYSVQPIRPSELLKDAATTGNLATSEKVLLNMIKLANLQPQKKQIPGKMLFFIIIGIIIIGYLVYQFMSGKG